MAPSIKLFLFVKKRTDLAGDLFSKQWLEHAAASCEGADRPARLTVCEAFADAAGGPPGYEGVTVSWFDDVEGGRRDDVVASKSESVFHPTIRYDMAVTERPIGG